MNLFMKLGMLMADNESIYENGKFVGAYAWLNPLLTVLQNIVLPILIVVATAGVIYAVYLGIMMAKAEDEGKREEAKKRIINVVIAIAVTIVLMVLFYALIRFLPDILLNAQNRANENNELIGLL